MTKQRMLLLAKQYQAHFIQSEEQGQVQRSNLRFSQYNLGLVFHTIYSGIFHPCYLLLLFPLLHFPPLQFCPYRIFHFRIFSGPLYVTE